MSELKSNRREFLKKLAGISTSVGTTGIVFGSIWYSMLSKFYLRPGIVIDTTIRDIPFKLHGILHCRKFAEKYHDSLDSLVRDASMVVSEASPEDIKSNKTSKDAKVYFGTITNLCQKYDKPVVYLDPVTSVCMTGELFVGVVGGTLMIDNVPKIVTESSTKRKFIKNSLKTVIGLYMFTSSFFTGLGLKKVVNKEFYQNERFFYNHIIDQRNVEIANRLLKLPNMLEKEDFNNGEYVLVEYGKGHIPGIMQYLKSPILRKIKTAMYALTFDLVDSERIEFYRYINESWEKRLLSSS